MNNDIELLKVLSNEIRLKIAKAIGDKEIAVGEIQKLTNLEQATVSQQLGRFRASKLASGRREGTKIYYKIIEPKVLAVLKALEVQK